MSSSQEKLLPKPPKGPDLDLSNLDLDLECGEDPPLNRAGEPMRRSLIDPRNYYCGLEVDPDGKGGDEPFYCDPQKGKQCPHCKKAQKFIEKTDNSRPTNTKGRVMRRGKKHRSFFYCGVKGCGPDKGFQCESCEETQDQICQLVAEDQNRDVLVAQQKEQMKQRSLSPGITGKQPIEDDTCLCTKCCKSCLDLECGLCKCCAKLDWEACKCCAKLDWLVSKWCCWLCAKLDWELCKCCVRGQELCVKFCCRAEIAFSECYFQCMKASAKICWKSPLWACALFCFLELFFVLGTFRLPTILKNMIGPEGYVWGFVLVIFIICCLLPCCALCAPCTIVIHEARQAAKMFSSLESRIEGLADSGIGLADQIGKLEDMFERNLGRVGRFAESVTHPSCLGRK